MRLKCTAKFPNKEQTKMLGKYYREGKQEFGILVGSEYIAFGMRILGGQPWVDICPIGLKYLHHVPLCLFDVIDPKVSKYWELRVVGSGDVLFFPLSLHKEYYHDDLLEGVPEVVKDLENLKALLENEET